ncbi:hypothetical protein [Mucilaginibacter glaciei]|uniref:Uncharacterized protein n=1 Tax=Mucilaginibacter glaciei TaxID=2772109 RepID=A0A926NZ88_9SPHI|nr:hypothetical protein [Mucilaginibacter glaciei]MBD1394648.1 hypothetical protein [Mucilaginibacter glaciei]
MNKSTIFLFLLVIFSLKIFDATIAATGVLKALCYAFMFVGIAISLPHFFKFKGGFVLAVQLISVSVLISVFMAQYTWGQGLSNSPTTIPYAIGFVFFFLMSVRVPIKTVENIVMIYGVIYILLFLFQFTHSGTVYFGRAQEFKLDRGIVRVNFPGAGVFFLACFIAINRVTSLANNYKYLYLLFALVAVVIIILQVTRQEIFVMLLVYLIHFLRSVKLPYKLAVIALFTLGGYLFIHSNNTVSKGLGEQQKQDASYGKDYIRILAADYYLTQFTPNGISKILGNGFANDTSNYGKSLIALGDRYGYFLTDVGIVEVYISFGIFAIIGYVLIFVKSFTIPVPSDYYYLKYYLWMIMLTCLTSDFLISYYFLITTVLVLYCYQVIYEQNKLKLSTNQS